MNKIFFLLFISTSLFGQGENKIDANGKKQGLWIGIFEESKRKRYEGTFENDIEKGTFNYFDDTKAGSIIATRTFSDNGTVAQTTFYDQNKNIVSQGKTVNRLKEGEWKYFHKSSKDVLSVENYINGKLEGVRKVYFIGKIIAEATTYVNGIKNGSYKKYTEKGIVLEESNFVNGKYEGQAIFRDSEGKMAAKGNFIEGGKKGLWQYYTNGKLKNEILEPAIKKIQFKKSNKENKQ